MDYNKLKTFVLVAKHGNVSVVARLLRRSQPAITQQIHSLEDDFGFRLVEGVRGKLSLTRQGTLVYEKTKAIFEDLDQNLSEVMEGQGQLRGHLKVVALNDGGNRLKIPELTARFLLHYPEIYVELATGTNDSIEQDLLSEKYDLGFTVIFSAADKFERWPMTIDHHNLYTSPSYRKKIGTVKSFADLSDSLLIDLNDRYLSLTPWVRKNFPKDLPVLSKRSPKLVSTSFSATASILEAEGGIAMLPEYLATQLGTRKVVKVFEKAKSTSSGLDLARPKSRTPNACEQAFIDFFCRHANDPHQ